MNPLKEKIIFHVFEFIETGDLTHSRLARDYLKEFSKTHHVEIRPGISPNIKEAFKEFILNEKGYTNTVTKLFNSL